MSSLAARVAAAVLNSLLSLSVLLIIMDDSKLIELVRDHPSIFNPKHPQYKDAYVRENVWTMVAKEMELPSKFFIFFLLSYCMTLPSHSRILI